MPGPIKVLRPTLPQLPAGASTNAVGSYQRDGVGLLAYPLMPVEMGRSYPTPVFDRSVPPIVITCGRPPCTVQMPPICQPPTTVLRNPFWTSTLLPLPTGRSHNADVRKRLRT